jgi:hypothetical protein
MSVPIYIYKPDIGHIFKFKHHGKQMSCVIAVGSEVSINSAYMSEFIPEDLHKMHVPDKLISQHLATNMASRLANIEYTSPKFYYIMGQFPGRHTAIWLESEEDAKILQETIENNKN